MNFHASTKVLIVDSAVTDYQSLIDSVGTDTEVIVLKAEQDGVAQITQVLSDRQNIQTLHILSHGESGLLKLGNTSLNLHSLERYAPSIRKWVTALAKNADVLLYGCKVAAGALGQSFVKQLSNLTGATIAASTNLTGSGALGGDWDLEFTTGQVRSPLAFQPAAMNAYEGVLVEFLNETFTGADVTDRSWLFGVDQPNNPTRANPFLTANPTVAAPAGGLQGNPGTPDAVGQGVLRLTNNTNDQAAFVLYNRALPANAGLSIVFDLFSYGGTGADGLSFFLIDGAVSPTTAGAFGGSLGYANRSQPTNAGVQGGFIGIGFDEFGNFSNPNEGRTGTAAGSGFVPDAVAIRGSEASGYTFLTNNQLAFGIDTPGAGVTRDQARRRVKIDITKAGLLSVQIDSNRDNDFDDPGEQPIVNFNVSSASGVIPSTLKFGFAAGTGDSTNFHELRNLSITDDVTPPVVTPPVVTPPVVTPPVISPPPRPGERDGDCLPGKRIIGTNRKDRLRGVPSYQDPIAGRKGNDSLKGYSCGDDINGGLGKDSISGGKGFDVIKGQRGRDSIRGNFNEDNIEGQRGNDVIWGGQGKDRIRGGLGDDRVYGGRNLDTIRGRRGKDTIVGSGGRDSIWGQQGNDALYGSNGNDTIFGGNGDDLITGGRARDTLIGGGGSDRFIYRAISERGDRIRDFAVSEDVIVVSQIAPGSKSRNSQPFADYIQLVQSGSSTLVRVDANGNSAGGFKPLVTLEGVAPSSLGASNFVF
jgi:Ca2+-binding RTX toxin-like protein